MAQSELRKTRGWKLFMLLPRMLLFRPVRGGMAPREQLEAGIGQWLQLLEESSNCAEKVHQNHIRRRRRRDDDDGEAKRAARVLSLVRVGELSAARQALEGAAFAPGTLATLAALTDLEKRSPFPRQELSQEVLRTEPAIQFKLDELNS